MSKRKKAKLKVVEPAPSKPSKAAAPTKLARTIALCEQKGGTTLDAIAKELAISNTAAASLIADARRKGRAVKRTQSADGVNCYAL